MAKTKYNRIKIALAEADKQNSELAKFMKVHETTVSDWCTNTNQPSIPDLFRIADFLKMDARMLLVSTKDSSS
jgi:putative transcriptional regulator